MEAQAQAEPQQEPRKVSIIADHRERRTMAFEWLGTYGAEILEKQLDVGDYIVSERVGIERKTVDDFLECIINQRLFRQLEMMSSSFPKPVLIIEGDQRSLFLSRNIHPNTIHGALSSVAVDHGIPIIWTDGPKATAAQIFWTACREQRAGAGEPAARVCKKSSTLAAKQEFLVAGLPSVNSVLGRRLLDRFGSVSRIFSLTEEELMAVRGIGEKKAREIWCLLNAGYASREGKPRQPQS